MSQENVEVVRAVLEAHNGGGIEAVLPLYSENIVWHMDPTWVEEPSYRGHDGVRRVDAIWTQNFDHYAWEIHEIRDLGDCVAAWAEMTGQIKGSGVTVRQPVGIIASDFRDGKVGDIRSYTVGWKKALTNLGLEE